MIDWMQKHKKYLIVTIWVASIAFVGAGFVGWGSYSLNKNKATAVAMVGNEPVSFKDFNAKYQDVFNAYYRMSNGNFSQEQADKMNLQYIALIESINERMRLNYAKDLGISASADEIANKIFALEQFQTDGKFDPKKYRHILKQNGNSPSNFEDLIKKEIILNKLSKVLVLTPNDEDLNLLNDSIFMQDKILVDIVKVDENSIKIDENSTKDFWEKNKNSYFTKKEYELETKFVEVKNVDVAQNDLLEFYEKHRSDYKNSDDTLMDFNSSKTLVKRDYEFDLVRQDALKTYVNLKNKKIQADGILRINDLNATFKEFNFDGKKNGDTIKPIKTERGYLITRIKNIVLPKQMSYEEAKKFVYADFKAKLLSDKLEEISKKKLENFDGKDIGFIGRDFNGNIEGLTKDQVKLFANNVFANNKLNGFIKLNDNLSAVYKITEQKIGNLEKLKVYKQYYLENLSNIKNKELLSDTTKELEQRYKIQNFYNPQEASK